MTLSYVIPIIIVIISNVVYHITTKNIPKGANSFLSLAITYLCGVIITAVMYFITSKSSSVFEDMHKLNWSSYILGLAIVGLEIGYIYMYRAGWDISKGSLFANISLAILLIIIGVLFYKEHISLYQIAGIICCIAGLILVNMH
jgi:drug/metabolite transporter (DMT)-like permease